MQLPINLGLPVSSVDACSSVLPSRHWALFYWSSLYLQQWYYSRSEICEKFSRIKCKSFEGAWTRCSCIFGRGSALQNEANCTHTSFSCYRRKETLKIFCMEYEKLRKSSPVILLINCFSIPHVRGRPDEYFLRPVGYTYLSHSCIFHSGNCWMTICIATNQSGACCQFYFVLKNTKQHWQEYCGLVVYMFRIRCAQQHFRTNFVSRNSELVVDFLLLLTI